MSCWDLGLALGHSPLWQSFGMLNAFPLETSFLWGLQFYGWPAPPLPKLSLSTPCPEQGLCPHGAPKSQPASQCTVSPPGLCRAAERRQGMCWEGSCSEVTSSRSGRSCGPVTKGSPLSFVLSGTAGGRQLVMRHPVFNLSKPQSSHLKNEAQHSIPQRPYLYGKRKTT